MIAEKKAGEQDMRVFLLLNVFLVNIIKHIYGQSYQMYKCMCLLSFLFYFLSIINLIGRE